MPVEGTVVVVLAGAVVAVVSVVVSSDSVPTLSETAFGPVVRQLLELLQVHCAPSTGCDVRGRQHTLIPPGLPPGVQQGTVWLHRSCAKL